MKNKLNRMGLAGMLAIGLALSPQISNAENLNITGSTQFERVYDNISLGSEKPFTYAVNPNKDLLIVDPNVKGVKSIALSYSGFKKDILASLGVNPTQVPESKLFSAYNLGVSAVDLSRMFSEDSSISNLDLEKIIPRLAEKFVEADYISRNFLKRAKTWDKRFLVDPRLSDFDKDGRSNLDRNHQITNPKKAVHNPSASFKKVGGHYVIKPSALIKDLRNRTTQTTLEKLMKFKNRVLANRAGHSAVTINYDAAKAKQFESAKNSIDGTSLNATFQNGRATTRSLIEAALNANPNDRAAAVEKGFKAAVLVDKSIYSNSKQIGGQN